jgi:hypothetical protein
LDKESNRLLNPLTAAFDRTNIWVLGDNLNARMSQWVIMSTSSKNAEASRATCPVCRFW